LPIINQDNRRAIEAQSALTKLFHDINLIWDIRDHEGYHQQYFCLDRPRLISQWLERNAEMIFPETSFNYHDYRNLWWQFAQNEDIISMVKFGSINTSTARISPIWLIDWWKSFGLNKEETDPNILNSFTPLYHVRDLNYQGPNDDEILRIFIMNHHKWGIKSKTILQRINGRLHIVRKIYTKSWDTLQYPERFSSFIENE